MEPYDGEPHFACADSDCIDLYDTTKRNQFASERSKSSACYGPQWSGRAAHADQRTRLFSHRERAPPLVPYVLSGSLSLSLSLTLIRHMMTARSLFLACSHALVFYSIATTARKCKCIEGETSEVLTRCAGPPGAVLSISAGTQHNTIQQRARRRLGSAALPDEDDECIQVGSVIYPSYLVFNY